MAQDTAHPTQHNTPSAQTAEQEPSGLGPRAHRTKHGANTPVNRSQVAQDTAHPTQHNTPSAHTGEQEPGGPRHHTRKATHKASTPMNRS